MLLRSSSTPILGSLLSSIPESPNAFDGNALKHSCLDGVKKLSFQGGGSHHHFHRFSCNSSPINHTVDWSTADRDREFGAESGGRRGVRRVQSDGNLQGLVGVDTEADDFHNSMSFRSSRRLSSKLETIPSFSLSRNRNREKEEEEEEEEGEWEGSDGGGRDLASIERTITFADGIMSTEGSFNYLSGEIHGQYLDKEEGSHATPPLLAKGVGFGLVDPAEAMAGGNDGNKIHVPPTGGDGGGDEADIEKYYQKMLAENPTSPLFLRNYAQYLYQTKRDYQKAEEFYSRAILAEPGDGEILSQYAKLIWEVHHNHDRAANYFEQSVQAAPEDSHVLAAYASFLWDTEESGDGEEEQQPTDFSQFPNYHETAVASTNS